MHNYMYAHNYVKLHYEATIHMYSHAVIYIHTYVRTNILPYEWYIWWTLSLAI